MVVGNADDGLDDGAIVRGRVWCGGVMPMWVSTLVYLAMGWGALFCYFELAKTYSHWTLLPLPLGGVFYSVGAVLNLARWPVLFPGVFAAHELFHFLVIAGSAATSFSCSKWSYRRQRRPPCRRMPIRRGRCSNDGMKERRHEGCVWMPHFPSNRPLMSLNLH